MKKNKILSFLLIVFMALSLTAKAQNDKKERQTKAGITTKVIELTKSDFLKQIDDFESNPNEWKYLGDKPAIIDFYATWCPPCKALAPVLDELAAEYDGKIYIYRIDKDKEKQLSDVFGIRAVPTLLFVPMGKKPQIAHGSIPKEMLKEAIERILINDTIR